MIEKKPSVKSKVEAVLFSSGQRMTLDNISRLCRSRKEDVLQALKELEKEYNEKESSLMLVEDGDYWKFTVRDHLISVVRKIVTETELSRSVLETLAVIAFKYPILQADLIKIRTNKAYDHLAELENLGYITRQKHSRTNLIKLTEKFFKYFDLTEEKLRDQFKDFDSIAKAIKEKEIEVDNVKEEQKRRAEELSKQDEKIKSEIESLDQAGEEFEIPLETYKASGAGQGVTEEFEQQGNLIVEKEKIGEIEIIEENNSIQQGKKHKKQKKEHGENAEQQIQQQLPEETIQNEIEAEPPMKEDLKDKSSEEKKEIFEKEEEQKEEKRQKGIFVTKDMEEKINKKVDEMLHGKQEKKE